MGTPLVPWVPRRLPKTPRKTPWKERKIDTRYQNTGSVNKFRKQTETQEPKKSLGLGTWTGLSTHTYKFHKNIQNVDLQVFYHMGQKSKHSDNRRPCYKNPKHKRSFGQKSRNSNPSSQKFHKIHIKSPKIMKSLPCIHNIPNYTFASFPSKIES